MALMPLIKSGSKQAFKTNVREMVHAGHPQKQALAAAYATARKYGRQEGGGVDYEPRPPLQIGVGPGFTSARVGAAPSVGSQLSGLWLPSGLTLQSAVVAKNLKRLSDLQDEDRHQAGGAVDEERSDLNVPPSPVPGHPPLQIGVGPSFPGQAPGAGPYFGMPSAKLDPERPTYLRVGPWDTKTEQSFNAGMGDKEVGVSTYALNPKGSPIAPAWRYEAGDEMATRLRGKEPKFLVQGDHVGIGADGEPLLRNVRAVGHWSTPEEKQRGGRVDAKHDIVSGADSSDSTTYIDRSIPHFSSKLKGKDGQKANLWKYLTIHENAERLAMKRGKSYERAHDEDATPAERKAVEADGVAWHDYSKEMAPYLTCAARKRPRSSTPKNLHVDPRKAIGRQDGGAVDEPDWPTSLPGDVERGIAPSDATPFGSFVPKEAPPPEDADIIGAAVKKTVSNVPASFAQAAKDFTAAYTSPKQTAKNVSGLTAGVLQKLGIVPGTGYQRYADAAQDYLVNRYGGFDKLVETIETDPVGFLGDMSTLLSGGAALVGKPGVIGKIGEIAETISESIDPVDGAIAAATLTSSKVAESDKVASVIKKLAARPDVQRAQKALEKASPVVERSGLKEYATHGPEISAMAGTEQKYGGRAEGGHAPLTLDVLGEQMQHHGVPLGGYAPKSGFSNPELAAAIRKLAATPREQAMAHELESGFAPNELRGMYEPYAGAMLNEPGRSFTGAPPQGEFTYGDLEGMGGDARGGRAMAGGGFAGGTPWYVRQEARGSVGHGMIGGGGFGRTDNLPINVPSGAYVVPADVVSGLGQGNSKAGAGVLHNMFSSGPLGMAAPKIHGGFGGPKNVRMGMMKMPRGSSSGSITTKQRFGVAAGGVAPSHTPIVAASGEFIIHPAVVRRIGGGDLKKGHDTLDHLMKIIRKEHIKTLKKLPGPVKRASGGRVPVPKTSVMEDLRDYLDTLNKLRDVA